VSDRTTSEFRVASLMLWEMVGNVYADLKRFLLMPRFAIFDSRVCRGILRCQPKID
jgi:hypothetical protein